MRTIPALLKPGAVWGSGAFSVSSACDPSVKVPTVPVLDFPVVKRIVTPRPPFLHERDFKTPLLLFRSRSPSVTQYTPGERFTVPFFISSPPHSCAFAHRLPPTSPSA